jgi:hypothetical protein
MPETGSLSRLQWFTILNTTLLALMAAESIIVCQCYQADMQRKMLDARLKQVRGEKECRWGERVAPAPQPGSFPRRGAPQNNAERKWTPWRSPTP